MSWWASNGPNCEPQYNLTQAVAVLPGGYYEVTPISVEGCIIPYFVIESLQAAVHLILTIFALVFSLITLTSLCCKKPGEFNGRQKCLLFHKSLKFQTN